MEAEDSHDHWCGAQGGGEQETVTMCPGRLEKDGGLTHSGWYWIQGGG